jgi:putative thioredoxin
MLSEDDAVQTDHSPVRDVNDAEFDVAVLQRSHDRPVVVDFWAPWCGPCRQLGPVLERLANESGDAWELVKVNIDHNPGVASRYRVQSIPAVKGFRDGVMAAEFLGAVPEAQVRAFLTRLLPSEADRLAREGADLEASGYLATAEDRFTAALAKDPNHPRAVVGLARVLAAREALAEARALRAQLTLRQATSGVDMTALEARLRENPEDAAAHYDLGRALAASGEYERALAHLLQTVKRDRTLDHDGARRAMVDIFALLGDADERTRSYRRQLGMVLF